VTGRILRTVNLNFSAVESIRLAFFIPEDTFSQLSSVGIQLFNDAGLTTGKQYTLASVQRGWNELDLLKADFSTVSTGSWDNPFVRLRFNLIAPAGGAATCYFDRFTAGVAGRPAVLLTFDDGYGSVYTAALPYLRSRNIRATLYASPAFVDQASNITSAQCVELDAAGWSVANHGNASTDLTAMTQGDAQADLTACKAWLDGLGLTKASAHVAYPGGIYNTTTVMGAMAAAGMLSGRTIINLTCGMPPGDNYYLFGKVLGNTISLATAKGYIDSIVTRGEVRILTLHHLVAGAPADGSQWNISDFQELVTYGIQNGVAFLTINDYYSLQSGPLAIPRAR
jgi:peptidoglycan/xylan/chitin deacetylase (PgdA/CDA1 family)